MRELTIGKNDAGQRLDRFVCQGPAAAAAGPGCRSISASSASRSTASGSKRDQRLQEGDVLQLYINDEFFDQPREDNCFLTLFRPSLDIVYEDENLMLLNKRPGLVGPRRRDGEGQHPHQPHPGLPLPEAGVEPPVGERLHPGAVQPHRPQHRRHRHRRQERRDPAHHQPEDPGP